MPPLNEGTPLRSMGADAQAPVALEAGTRVAEFEVKRVLGSGGFGIVYLAWDHQLEREVALKEYMPGTLADRGRGLAVSVRSQSMADTFALGLRSFVNEARLLARFDHPSLVKVYRFWEDNGTAYMVMPYYVGRTLRQVRAGMVVPPGEGGCRRVLEELLSALEVLHKEGVFHRDIAPDNILLTDDGTSVLLDFGAARRVIGEGNKALTSIMKPHFAPLEQYADQGAMRQGPWTDLYALGGTIYFLITGREPVPAASRALHDDQPRLLDLRPADCSPGFLAAIDWMLALKPAERPQSVHMLRDVLEGRMAVPGRQAQDRTVPGVASRERVDIPTGPGDLNTDFNYSSAAATADTRTLVIAPPGSTVPPTHSQPAAVPTPPPPAASVGAPVAPRRWAPLALLAALLLLNVLAWWWFTRRETPSAPPVLPAAAASPAAPAAAAASVPAPAANDSGGNETILSVLPARSPMRAASAAAAGAASAPAPLAQRAASAPGLLPRVAADGAVVRGAEPLASAPRVSTRVGGVASGAAPETLGPRARCGERTFLALLMCMKRECDAAALRGHPECVKMREQEEAGQNSNR